MPTVSTLQNTVTGPALRRPSISLHLSTGTPVLEVRDSIVVQMVQNRELPPNRRQASPSCTQRLLQGCSKVLAGATLVYALWSIINYLAPRGGPDSSGMPEQPDFDFDHL